MTQQKNKFLVGTLVHNHVFGRGTVIVNSNCILRGEILVKFDKSNTLLHDGGAVANSNCCYYFYSKNDSYCSYKNCERMSCLEIIQTSFIYDELERILLS